MLHDPTLHRAADPEATGERRASDRSAGSGELVLSWSHDRDNTMRYQLIDVGDGGMRIQSSVPQLTGTIGLALRLLPEGEKLDQTVMVVWVRQLEDGQYDIGLRCV
ncbi:MAG: PilZ domain-containing protein [Planctomycetota bacterium]|nr:PilZ domain-containing protein [Planctomycetota bacterium]